MDLSATRSYCRLHGRATPRARGPGGTRTVSLRGFVAIVVSIASVGAVGCGGDDDGAQPNVIRAGQVDIRLPDGWTVTEEGATRPPADRARAAAPGGAAPGESAATADTVPLAEDDPQTAFFTAVGTFTQCLDERGFTFIGIPDQANPSSPTNEPTYLEALGTCASKSNILQALEEVRAFEDALTPEEIEERNESYLTWRDCMIDRGWGIPEPKPDEKGRLFTFGNAGQNGPPQFDAPAGEDLLTSDDFGACLEEAAG
jgi:hypothetical protein